VDQQASGDGGQEAQSVQALCDTFSNSFDCGSLRASVMATNHGRPYDKREEAQAPSGRAERRHPVLEDSDAGLEQRRNAMIASGEAKPMDGFLHHPIVSP
jgi:hypothetical protein